MTTDRAIVIDTPEGIAFVRLCALRGACRLELVGLKRRGRSALSIARERLGLSSRHPGSDVVAKLDAEIAAVHAAREQQS
jgi:hypothetical protein